jgi:DNA-directed RNA polymerase subunit L
MDSIDIKIIELEKQIFKELQPSKLILKIDGKSSNLSLLNSLRRLTLNNIPTYAFSSDTIYITENTSIFNNDEMRCRLSQVTIPNIEIPIAYLSDEYWKNIQYNNKDRIKHKNDKNIIEMYINYKNVTTSNVNVTTNDTKIYIDGDEINKFDNKYPHLLIQLRPQEAFKCRMLATLGIGKRNNIWAGAANAFYDEIGKNSYKLTILSQGQIDEYELLYKGCIIMKKELDSLKVIIGTKYKSSTIAKQYSIKLKLENKDYTLGSVINEYLQINKNVAFSGIARPDLLVEEVVITLTTFKPNPLNVLFETIDFLDKLFNEIQNLIKKLGNKYITFKS